ncbi:phage terminase large subunit family protein [Desulfobaculum senezii]
MPQTDIDLSNEEGIRRAIRGLMGMFRPPERLTVSEWADKYRRVSVANAMPGPWRTDNAPYQRGPMDCMSDARTYRVSLMWSAQVGKTECENNAIGYYIDLNPKSCIMMQPTQSDGKVWLETKLTPLINETPQVGEKVAKPRGRDGVNNATMKSYPGGILLLAYSGSTRTMRGRSAPIIICDEVDGYSMTEEGDPIELLWQRASTFGDQKKLIESSTPTIKGFSRIEKAFEAGDKRRYYVPCPHCGAFQTLQWGNVKWDHDEQGGHLPETAYYVCESCGCVIEDKDKPAMLAAGEWRAEKPFRGHASFHLNELYSPWRRWRDIAQSFLDKKHRGDLQSFVNVSLAETWEEEGEQVDETGLRNRCEQYAAPVPMAGLLLTAGVDTQPDRLEIEVVAWGHEEESWSIDYHVIYGDPDQSSVWEALDDYLERRWLHESGVELSIHAACIDSGGSNTQAVYNYCRSRWAARRWAIKGKGGEGVPIVGAPRKLKTGKGKKGRPVRLFSIGVDQAKTLLYKRLPLDGSGPGRLHFPATYAEFDEYFQQITAEKCITRYVKGFPKREWVKTRPRNEALDCRVYAYAALLIARPNFQKLESRLQSQSEVVALSEPAEASQNAVVSKAEVQENPPKERKKRKVKKRRKRRSNFVMG